MMTVSAGRNGTCLAAESLTPQMLSDAATKGTRGHREIYGASCGCAPYFG